MDDVTTTKKPRNSKENFVEDMGDSDSSSTPLIPSKGNDTGSLIKMEKLPKSASTTSEKSQNEDEKNEEAMKSQDPTDIVAKETKKKATPSDKERIFKNKKPLDRTTSTPNSSSRKLLLDDPLSPIREFKSIKSYEKGGSINNTTLQNCIDLI